MSLGYSESSINSGLILTKCQENELTSVYMVISYYLPVVMLHLVCDKAIIILDIK